MLDMGLGINMGDFEMLTEDEYEDYMLEQAEDEMTDMMILNVRLLRRKKEMGRKYRQDRLGNA